MKPACKCLEALDKKMAAERGYMLDRALNLQGQTFATLNMMPVRSPGDVEGNAVAAKKRRNKSPPLVVCTFCPFCGKERYPKKKGKT